MKTQIIGSVILLFTTACSGLVSMKTKDISVPCIFKVETIESYKKDVLVDRTITTYDKNDRELGYTQVFFDKYDSSIVSNIYENDRLVKVIIENLTQDHSVIYKVKKWNEDNNPIEYVQKGNPQLVQTYYYDQGEKILFEARDDGFLNYSRSYEYDDDNISKITSTIFYEYDLFVKDSSITYSSRFVYKSFDVNNEWDERWNNYYMEDVKLDSSLEKRTIIYVNKECNEE